MLVPLQIDQRQAIPIFYVAFIIYSLFMTIIKIRGINDFTLLLNYLPYFIIASLLYLLICRYLKKEIFRRCIIVRYRYNTNEQMNYIVLS